MKICKNDGCSTEVEGLKKYCEPCRALKAAEATKRQSDVRKETRKRTPKLPHGKTGAIDPYYLDRGPISNSSRSCMISNCA